jgi:hypothetical protein
MQFLIFRTHIKLSLKELGTVTYIYNPSYSGDRDWGRLHFKGNPGKKLVRSHLNKQVEHGGS